MLLFLSIDKEVVVQRLTWFHKGHFRSETTRRTKESWVRPNASFIF